MEMGKEIVPVFETEEFGKDDQCAVSDVSDALEITPETFQC